MGGLTHAQRTLNRLDGLQNPRVRAKRGLDAYAEDRAAPGFTWRVARARLMLNQKDGAQEVPMEGLLVISTLTILRIVLPLGLLLLLGTIAERRHNRAMRTG